MRTAIFVYESTTITIKCNDSGLQVVPYVSGISPFAPTGEAQSVSPGLYKILSTSAVSVESGASSSVVISSNSDKDKWPDPPPVVLPSSMSGATAQQISDFFVDVRSLAS